MNLRSFLDEKAHEDSKLRKLACAISSLDCKTHGSFFKGVQSDWPFNFLTNGATANYWEPPTGYSAHQVASWKQPDAMNAEAKHGFATFPGQSNKGLALLFDPLADAFLASHWICGKKLFSDTTVLVTTDYYPFQCLSFPHINTQDWALDETEAFMRGSHGHDHTADNLLGCLTKTPSWRKAGLHLRTKNASLTESPFVKAISKRNVLLWNFFPFFRGGSSPTSCDGLPPRGDWQLLCWEFLSEFLSAVEATRVVFCCSEDVIDRDKHYIPRSSDNLGNGPFKLKPVAGSRLRRELPRLPSSVRETYRLYHPCYGYYSGWKDAIQFNQICA